MANNASVMDSFMVDAERQCARTGTDPAFAPARAAQLPPVTGRGGVPLLEILTDPAMIRIACLAVGIPALFLAIAAAL